MVDLEMTRLVRGSERSVAPLLGHVTVGVKRTVGGQLAYRNAL
jgi:hypothetical protein